MFFRLTPNDGIEPYIGAMGHMLAASSDLIDPDAYASVPSE